MNDPLLILQNKCSQFLSNNLIIMKNEKDVYYNLKQNKKKLLTVPYGEDPLFILASFFQSDEGQAVFTLLSNRLKKLESIGFISKQKGTVNKKSIYYLLEKRGFDTFPIMIEMAIFTTKHFFDHLGTTYTGDVKKRMLKDKLDYTKELISNYKQFVRLQTF